MKPLTVYKASAGSGKTFTLAVEYIKLLMHNPQNYSGILAVTFTNKATEEMKLRILSQLYGIWQLLPKSKDYINRVTEDLCIDRPTASRKAGVALNWLIHNYSQFRIETIDAFFQTVLRNLARELDLTANLRIELNDSQVEEQAVDSLIESLNTNSLILKWLISYIESNINDNKSWNVIGQIKSFGRTIFREFYKTASKGLEQRSNEKDFFRNYMAQLRAIRTDAEKRMTMYADEFERITKQAGLETTAFAGRKRGICCYFNKLRSRDFSDASCMNATLAKCLESAENWTTKTSPDRDTIIELADKTLINLLRSAETQRPKLWRLYMSADVTLRHLDKLRLLNSIETKVRDLNKDANRFLLSDTQYLLHTLIKDSDSPFIFEKIGSRLNHVMIDEFQDTSRVQWQNFKVLLQECISHAVDNNNIINNLIVGDVKQSIYRWRSGDWRLLNDLSTQFDNAKDIINFEKLETNYRSEYNIIKFNNIFFAKAAQLECESEREVNSVNADEIITAYKDVNQKKNDETHKKGYVKVMLFDKEDYDKTMLDSTIETVDQLVKAGVELKKIAILIRYNKHIPAIAAHFMMYRPEYKVVSDEAFRLDASLAVNTIMQALRVLDNPADVLSKASLVMTYQRKILKRDITESEAFSGDNLNATLDRLLPAGFMQQRESLLKLPMYDIIEEIYSRFNISVLNDQSAYLCAFYDSLSAFITDNSGNIDSFIKEWDENLCSKTIKSDETDGIRLISIHKSKGLEFDNVIIPYCDWMLENLRGNTLWCKPTEEPFCQLPVVPVDYSKKLLDTIYADDYRDEHLQNTVDNLNLLYVAFTRAHKNLFVFGKLNGARTRSELLNTCLPQICGELEGSCITESRNSGDPTIFEYGELYVEDKDDDKDKKKDKKKQEPEKNVFLQKATPLPVPFVSNKVALKFRQSNNSSDFIGDNSMDDEHNTYIKLGTILHNLFSQIHTTADIDRVLRQFEFDGVLYDHDITADKMRTLLAKRLSDPRVAEWFDPHWTSYNEFSILYIDPKTGNVKPRRPDRVITDGKEMIVIDFKFAIPIEKHYKQVRRYMRLLGAMGYKNVRGYLWYVYPNNIEEVKLYPHTDSPL